MMWLLVGPMVKPQLAGCSSAFGVPKGKDHHTWQSTLVNPPAWGFMDVHPQQKYGLGAGSIPNEKQGNACAKGNEPMSKAHKINSSKGQRDKNYPTSERK